MLRLGLEGAAAFTLGEPCWRSKAQVGVLNELGSLVFEFLSYREWSGEEKRRMLLKLMISKQQ